MSRRYHCNFPRTRRLGDELAPGLVQELSRLWSAIEGYLCTWHSRRSINLLEVIVVLVSGQKSSWLPTLACCYYSKNNNNFRQPTLQCAFRKRSLQTRRHPTRPDTYMYVPASVDISALHRRQAHIESRVSRRQQQAGVQQNSRINHSLCKAWVIWWQLTALAKQVVEST